MKQSGSLPETGYVRLPQIVGTPADPTAQPPKPATPGVIPVSKSTWWLWVKTGKAPKPVKLSERCTAWKVQDIREFIERLAVLGG